MRRADGTSAALDARRLLAVAGFHPIVRGFPEGALVVFDEDQRYLCAGGQGLASVGLTQEMLEGRTIHEVFPPAVVAELDREAVDCWGTGWPE